MRSCLQIAEAPTVKKGFPRGQWLQFCYRVRDHVFMEKLRLLYTWIGFMLVYCGWLLPAIFEFLSSIAPQITCVRDWCWEFWFIKEHSGSAHNKLWNPQICFFVKVLCNLWRHQFWIYLSFNALGQRAVNLVWYQFLERRVLERWWRT